MEKQRARIINWWRWSLEWRLFWNEQVINDGMKSGWQA
jgi:hypothetical protein